MTKEMRMFPIGTVVMLKNSTAAVMIAGFLAESEGRPGYIWDYSGFLYPIGLRDNNEVYTFDQSQIEEVLALGYQDGESFGFMQRLLQAKEKMLQAEAQRNQEQEGTQGLENDKAETEGGK